MIIYPSVYDTYWLYEACDGVALASSTWVSYLYSSSRGYVSRVRYYYGCLLHFETRRKFSGQCGIPVSDPANADWIGSYHMT